MTELQKTIFGTAEPPAPHRDDIVTCRDNTECRYEDAFFDCRGEAHSTEEDRDYADVTIVEELLDAQVAWAAEYATENEDYADAYSCLISEGCRDLSYEVEEWLDDNYDDCPEDAAPYDYVKAYILDRLDNCMDYEVEFSHSEYAAYSGSGICLDGFAIGDCEEQVDVDNSPELSQLYDEGRLSDILDRVNCDAYVSSWSINRLRRDYAEGRDHACFEYYHNPGGRWDFVVSYSVLKDYVESADEAWSEENADCNE